MKTEELNFIGNDPGAVKYGNFINYYTFHSATQRIANLHPEMFPTSLSDKPILCLDIGCNTGELTNELFKYIRNIYPNTNIYMLAIDIDPNLIERAQESNFDNNISYQAVNIMNKTDCIIIQEYLTKHESTMFDITFCFSVTMWIHINYGDEELLKFLQYLKNSSKTIIIEPQPWSCYRNAQRRVKKSGDTFPLYDKLKLRNNLNSVIESILLQNKTHRKIFESANSNWNRKIQSYNLEIS